MSKKTQKSSRQSSNDTSTRNVSSHNFPWLILIAALVVGLVIGFTFLSPLGQSFIGKSISKPGVASQTALNNCPGGPEGNKQCCNSYSASRGWHWVNTNGEEFCCGNDIGEAYNPKNEQCIGHDNGDVSLAEAKLTIKNCCEASKIGKVAGYFPYYSYDVGYTEPICCGDTSDEAIVGSVDQPTKPKVCCTDLEVVVGTDGQPTNVCCLVRRTDGTCKLLY
ncbi:hypothetical protein HZB02_03230 [Candidatus Woesearchaeota archaeon]|nr:hypothetical protein [Candidatus Woesearchaeota archaeon]